MTVSAPKSSQRRGACPGLSAPMATGDGLLVRLMPIGTMTFDAFAALCAAARQHGNGIVEVTSRGSIQIRGLSEASAPRFAAAVAGLGIAAEDGVAVLSDPLAGLDPEEVIDAGALAADLRRAWARSSLAQRLSAKASVAIDGGGSLDLDGLAADVRLRAEASNGGAVIRVGIGGDGMSVTQLGIVLPRDAVAAAVRFLEILAQRGRNARARDVVAAEGIAVFQSAVADFIRGEAPPRSARRSGDVIGAHRLRDGSSAYGVGLAFGHADATSLERLSETAKAAGARGMRAAPGRALMIIGLAQQTSSSLAADAEALGFIVRADDPRRHVVACAGAPICASAKIAARAIAPVVAAAAAPHLDGSFKIHISGCAKGCAHPAAAALTVVGTAAGCALIANGSVHDAAFKTIATNELPAAIAEIVRNITREGGHV
jgi:precorrin-3B synthase